ncbi:MAG: pseudouridine synthase [Gammaproteobacteria bacterium]|nr:pseudouridine synthase [Gammaproteobacteria bacterium]
MTNLPIRDPMRNCNNHPMATQLIACNKPYDMLCQFSDVGGARRTLADCLRAPGFRPAGRLDRDSEGLVLLTGDGKLQQRIAHPRFKLWKTYWVQVEGVPDDAALRRLATGVLLNDGPTQPARAKRMEEPADLWRRDPPIRFRANIPATWISLSIREGRNRQVRRMTAAVGHPTLRLIRYAIGAITLDGLAPGAWRYEDPVRLKGSTKD